MKDLYTFDHSEQQALQTYELVRKAYSSFFNEFKIPYLVAEADSGSIGGNLSHEFHFPTSKGEDNIISCTSCTYVANEELGISRAVSGIERDQYRINRICFHVNSNKHFARETLDVPKHLQSQIQSWFGINHKRNTLYQCILPFGLENGNRSPSRETKINSHNLKHHFKEIDLGIENPLKVFTEYIAEYIKGSKEHQMTNQIPSVERVFDYRIPQSTIDACNSLTNGFMNNSIPQDAGLPDVDLVRVESGDKCPLCEQGTLSVQKAVELGHTFFLGTRYSEPLNAKVVVPASTTTAEESTGKPISGTNIPTTIESLSTATAIQMGCHGIGVSRMIEAVAGSLADEKGLNWPRVIAPFEAVIIPAKGSEDDAIQVLDTLRRDESEVVSNPLPQEERLGIDAILDDREKEMVWKLKDADLIGYPIIIVLGRAWKKEKKCEVQCRRLSSLKENISLEHLRRFVTSLLVQL